MRGIACGKVWSVTCCTSDSRVRQAARSDSAWAMRHILSHADWEGLSRISLPAVHSLVEQCTVMHCSHCVMQHSAEHPPPA